MKIGPIRTFSNARRQQLTRGESEVKKLLNSGDPGLVEFTLQYSNLGQTNLGTPRVDLCHGVCSKQASYDKENNRK